MRIVIAVEGARRRSPMLALGESLRRAGHEVVLCAPPEFHDAVEARGLAFRPVGRNVREYLEREALALDGMLSFSVLPLRVIPRPRFANRLG